jgi:hypothetical protein
VSAAYRPPCDEGVIRSGPVLAPCDPQTGRWVLAATILGTSMAFIDGTVVNVALPALQRDPKATAADVQWVVEAYTLLLTGGSLGDRLGRRRIFGAGITLFALASLGCGVAPGPRALIAARAAQGIGAALLVPGSLAIISAAFPDAERGRAIGTWSGFSAITTALGPVLGGHLIEHISWRGLFSQPAARSDRAADPLQPCAGKPGRGRRRTTGLVGRAAHTRPRRRGLRPDRSREPWSGRFAGARRADRRQFGSGSLRRRRGPQSGADGATQSVPLQHVQRCQPADISALRGAGRCSSCHSI